MSHVSYSVLALPVISRNVFLADEVVFPSAIQTGWSHTQSSLNSVVEIVRVIISVIVHHRSPLIVDGGSFQSNLISQGCGCPELHRTSSSCESKIAKLQNEGRTSHEKIFHWTRLRGKTLKQNIALAMHLSLCSVWAAQAKIVNGQGSHPECFQQHGGMKRIACCLAEASNQRAVGSTEAKHELARQHMEGQRQFKELAVV